MVGEFADYVGDVCQSDSDVAVPWGVNRQFLVHTGNTALLQQLSPFRAQEIDPSADPIQIGLSPPVAVRKVAAEAPFDGIGEDLCDQEDGMSSGAFSIALLGGTPATLCRAERHRAATARCCAPGCSR